MTGNDDLKDGEQLQNLERLRLRFAKLETSLATRRLKEADVMSYAERRRLKKTGRTEQTNIKFRPADKKKYIALADRLGLTLTQCVEYAMERLIESLKKAAKGTEEGAGRG